MSFNTVPSWYGNCSFASNRNGAVYQGGAAPQITLSKTGATAYEVRDYSGAVISSGPVAGTTCTPAAPSGGWLPGWYRVYFTGPSTDPVTGNAYAATNFVVLRNDARFPAMPSPVTGGPGGNESCDIVGKAIFGLGTSRQIIASYVTPTTGVDTIANAQTNAGLSATYWHGPGVADAARPREMWVSTPGTCADGLTVAGTAGSYLAVYAKTGAVNGTQVFVASGPGTLSGSKVTISSPDAVTVVETFDNLTNSAAAAATINAGSAYVKTFSKGATLAATTAATAIGRTVWDGIVQTVQALYPDIKHYEFTNEPGLTTEVAHQCLLFTAAVHAGNADAKSMGPCPVDIGQLTNWRTFLSVGGGDNVDELSFHDYNSSTCGNLGLGRTSVDAFLALLAEFGLSGKRLWQTEAGAQFTGVYGVHHPRRARVKIMHTLMWEQYGIPRERNVYWYDRSHGFWPFPTFWQHGDQSVTPDAVVHRVLAEETFGLVHTQRFQFGKVGDRVLLGSRYGDTTRSVVVLCAASHIPGFAVTLDVTGASTVTTVTAFGVEATIPVVAGRVTVPVTDVPTYVRGGAGVTVTPYRVSDWPPIADASKWASASPRATAAGSGANPQYATDDALIPSYGTGVGMYQGAGALPDTLPDTLTFTWTPGARVDRVIIWNGMSWQTGSSLIDFDVQTSTDGVTWTTQATVTRPASSSFLFGTNSTNTWCTQETYWDEQWIHDVKFPEPVTATHVRLSVRDTSLGGEPDAAAVAAGGQGDSAKRISVQEMAVLCDANTVPMYVRQ